MQRLTVSHAFHSRLIEPMLDELEKFAATLKFDVPKISLVSNVFGPSPPRQCAMPGTMKSRTKSPWLRPIFARRLS